MTNGTLLIVKRNRDGSKAVACSHEGIFNENSIEAHHIENPTCET